MLRALYSSATGMKAQETLLDVTANNLANVNTTGFKRSHVNFADLLYATVRQAGAQSAAGQQIPVGLQIGSGARAVATTKLFTPGTPQQTGNNLDVAIEGDGFFQIQMPSGEIRYTRDGSFHMDSAGNLVNADGYLLQPGITISPDATAITILPDGTVSTNVNGVETPVGQIDLARFINPAGLSSTGGNLYAQTTASGDPLPGQPGLNGLGTLRQGFLEESNVQMVTELISLITAQRAYEVNARAIRAGDEMLSTTSQIMR
ncbi:MAG: flagellar basal-body rod protein FlgG [Pirellulaceae bacterium]|nr:flagellar basal-body rod protein FlgG [Planctomycetales bacterium]